ncbi:MAG: tRNA (adenosine(37)-N6)-threonylcarbamoyltransferase complex ATPase subunit type 1 TsaE [Gammaproteobacteria bacterium]|nr:tRNA (adenosine(37)-N6)-threonylcarbamoyltransferase complex ATPase subunit type 1 TsaE [Gammaproteobacteria bacterium]
MLEQLDMHLSDEPAMLAFGQQIAAAVPSGFTIYLYGDLGAGKTTLVRGILHAMGHQGAVKSPTYTLVEPYTIQQKEVYHFDLYRLGEPEELEYMGVRDYFHEHSLCLVEWPAKGEGFLPEADLSITIEHLTEGRNLKCRATSKKGEVFLQQLGK